MKKSRVSRSFDENVEGWVYPRYWEGMIEPDNQVLHDKRNEGKPPK